MPGKSETKRKVARSRQSQDAEVNAQPIASISMHGRELTKQEAAECLRNLTVHTSMDSTTPPIRIGWEHNVIASSEHGRATANTRQWYLTTIINEEVFTFTVPYGSLRVFHRSLSDKE